LINLAVSLIIIFCNLAFSCDQDSIFGPKTFDNQNTEIIADNISFDKKHSEFLASVNVKIISKLKSGERIEAFGNSAKYNTKTGKGEIGGKDTMIKYFTKTSPKPVIIRAKEIQFDKGNESIGAYEDVFVITSSGTIISDNVVFDKKTSMAVFEKDKKRPVADIMYDNRKQIYEADKMILYDSSDVKKIFMEGSVKGKIGMEDIADDIKN
jgi:lipopolysaccharide assembly outer membrane protein LptD (OstA)